MKENNLEINGWLSNKGNHFQLDLYGDYKEMNINIMKNDKELFLKHTQNIVKNGISFTFENTMLSEGYVYFMENKGIFLVKSNTSVLSNEQIEWILKNNNFIQIDKYEIIKNKFNLKGSF